MTDMVEDVEYTNPVEALEAEGHEVEVISTEAREIDGKQCVKFKVDKSIADVSADDYDVILIPGGFSPDLLRSDEQVRFGKFAAHFLQNDKPTFAICHGPQVLIDTDLLTDRNMTSFLSVRKDLENAGAKVQDASVV